MTDETEHPEQTPSDTTPEATTPAEPPAPIPPKVSVLDRIRPIAGWVLWCSLFIVMVAGFVIALTSTPQQVNLSHMPEPTVPRKAVLDPQTQSTVWPGHTPPPTYMPVSFPDPTMTTASLPDDKKKQPEPAVETPVAAVVTTEPPQSQPVISDTVKTTPEKPHHDTHAASFKNPVIAIVIDDMGLDRRHSLQMMALASPVTLAFMPYAPHVDALAQQARDNGHELIVHMPMEPDDLAHNNPGPNALLLKNGQAENTKRLTHNLTQFDGYMGINNHMGSAFTSNRAAITPVLKDIKSRGLWFLDSKTDARSVAATVADELGLPYASRDVFLDNVNTKPAVLAQLRQTEQIARQKGYAIAIGHPKEGTVTALQQWLPQAAAKGFTLVPLSSIIAARFPAATVPQYARAKADKTASR